MTGRFIAFVGPSGVGKDSVMSALVAKEPRLTSVRRVVTRPADAGGEDFDAVSPETFERMKRDGAFALFWSAHGLQYGIPTSVDATLATGQDVLANLSRGVLTWAVERFSSVEIIALTVSPEVLFQRLTQRGRESPNEIARRLARASFPLPPDLDVTTIDNSGPVERTVADSLDYLYPVSEKRCIS